MIVVSGDAGSRTPRSFLLTRMAIRTWGQIYRSGIAEKSMAKRRLESTSTITHVNTEYRSVDVY